MGSLFLVRPVESGTRDGFESTVLVLAISGCEADGFEAGVEAFNQGDYATALNTFRPLAEQGEAQAQFKLRVVWECPAGPFAESGSGKPQFLMASDTLCDH